MKKTLDTILLTSAVVSLISVVGVGIIQHVQYSRDY